MVKYWYKGPSTGYLWAECSEYGFYQHLTWMTYSNSPKAEGAAVCQHIQEVTQ